MLHYDDMHEALPVFKALSAEVRIQIMEILYKDGDRNLNDIARMLHLSNSAITQHMSKLEEAGLVKVHTISGKRGAMKVCKPTDTSLFVELSVPQSDRKFYMHEIEIGHYTLSHAEPTCGLATLQHLIGEYDDPRYFAFPQRFHAAILWLTDGFVEYSLPNSLKAGETVTELSFSMELSSEAPGVRDDYPSDLYFSINGVPVGTWISPGDFGNRRGRFNPLWWPDGKNQYGLLKQLTVNQHGSFIDEAVKVSDTTIDALHITHNSVLTLRIASPAETRNAGGLTLYGKGFGDYNQGIKMLMFYE